MTAGTYQNFSRANNERFARLRRGLAIFDVRVFRAMISSGFRFTYTLVLRRPATSCQMKATSATTSRR
jgi:hypothetical protein